MKSLIGALLILAVCTSSAAVGADAPQAVKSFKATPEQQRQFSEVERLKIEYDKIAAPYEKEVDAWFSEAMASFQKPANKSSPEEWRFERKKLLRKLEEIQSKKDPRIDQIDQRMESAFREVLKTIPSDRK